MHERNDELPEHDKVLRARELKQKHRVQRCSWNIIGIHDHEELIFASWVHLNVGNWLEIEVPVMSFMSLGVCTFYWPNFDSSSHCECSKISVAFLEDYLFARLVKCDRMLELEGAFTPERQDAGQRSCVDKTDWPLWANRLVRGESHIDVIKHLSHWKALVIKLMNYNPLLHLVKLPHDHFFVRDLQESLIASELKDALCTKSLAWRMNQLFEHVGRLFLLPDLEHRLVNLLVFKSRILKGLESNQVLQVIAETRWLNFELCTSEISWAVIARVCLKRMIDVWRGIWHILEENLWAIYESNLLSLKREMMHVKVFGTKLKVLVINNCLVVIKSEDLEGIVRK